jgi:hypothetical protein
LPVERLWSWIQMDEDMAVPESGEDRVKRVVFGFKPGQIHMRSAEEPAVQTISPAVIRALNAIDPALWRGTHSSATVTADVVVGPYGSRRVAYNDHALAGDLTQEIISRAGNRGGATRANPAPEKEFFEFAMVQIGIRVEPGRESQTGQWMFPCWTDGDTS